VNQPITRQQSLTAHKGHPNERKLPNGSAKFVATSHQKTTIDSGDLLIVKPCAVDISGILDTMASIHPACGTGPKAAI
jgi:hypothetical protein